MSRYNRKMKHTTRMRNQHRQGRHAGSKLGYQTATRQVTKQVQDSESGEVMSATAYKRIKRLAKEDTLSVKVYGKPKPILGVKRMSKTG